MVDMAHDGDDRRARLQGRRIVGAFAVNRPSSTSDSATRLTRVAELFGDQLRGIGVDHVVDGRHVTLLHQQADDIHAALGHAVGKFLDGDGFRNGDFANELFLRLVAGMAFQALRAAAE